MIFRLIVQNPVAGLIVLFSIVMAISIHEAAHAYLSVLLGDDTPRIQGRLTLNPLSHLDKWGTITLLFIGIGWGRPVMFNPYNLKNPRRDTALVAIAGPASNLILALLIALGVRAIDMFVPGISNLSAFSFVVFYLIYINVALALFNLLPVEPLDGFKVVAGILPPGLAYQWEETRKYGLYILLFLLITGTATKIISPAVSFLFSLYSLVLGSGFHGI